MSFFEVLGVVSNLYAWKTSLLCIGVLAYFGGIIWYTEFHVTDISASLNTYQMHLLVDCILYVLPTLIAFYCYKMK